ncbi:phosphoribosylaminoimidazole carboxylase ade2 [Peltigera leucophlebia]|nr:phosphoribosylaminoimidazole carboxylase ade2 [Peltigera leucophlebia]
MPDQPSLAAIKVSESDLTVLPDTRYLATRRARKSLAYKHCLSASISRTFADICFKAASKDLKVTIATADGPAHLPGMKASMALLIVIGVPLNAFSLGVMNSLLSVAQMPAILHSDFGGNSRNQNSADAAELAARIPALDDAEVRLRLNKYL